MIYDYIIVGGGIAGSVCAYELGKKGKRCLILERNSRQAEKVCGGGVSYKALRMLKEIGIAAEPLFLMNARQVGGHVIYEDGGCTEKLYGEGRVSLGIQRTLLDQYLLCAAAHVHAQIQFGQRAAMVTKSGELYEVNGFLARELVWASGARGISGEIPKEQSIGLSGQIAANVNLAEDRFHYWYFDAADHEKYFWAFPIGGHLWNVGVWNRHFDRKLRNDYQHCLEAFFLHKVSGKWEYVRKPRAEFLGHCDQRRPDSYRKNGIGDFAGTCNPVNGGGIHYAIRSAIAYAGAEGGADGYSY